MVRKESFWWSVTSFESVASGTRISKYFVILGGLYGSNGYLFAFFWRIREVIWFAVRWTTGIGHRMWSVWLGREYIETILQIIVYWSMSKRCSSVTVSLISFLSIDIQSVSLVIYACFLYHYGITTLSQAIWMENRNCAYTHLYSSVLQITKAINTRFPSL